MEGSPEPSPEGAPEPPPATAPPEPPPAAPVGSPEAADEAGHDAFAERPEVFVGAAFAGGLVLATVLRVIAK